MEEQDRCTPEPIRGSTLASTTLVRNKIQMHLHSNGSRTQFVVFEQAPNRSKDDTCQPSQDEQAPVTEASRPLVLPTVWPIESFPKQRVLNQRALFECHVDATMPHLV